MTCKGVLVIIAVFGVTYAKNVPVVNTKLGQIRGLQAEDGDYSMYLGIPYADIDEKRPFTDSTPHPPFENIFDANDDSTKCPQQHEYTKKIEGDFGCLHLNVYVPNNIKPNETLPVLVWFHGGRLVQGDSSRFLYGPKFLMKHDIIFITFNYRLGPYGFLCLDTPEVPGNQGMKDQVLLLRWIKNNIEAFGGDADRVTVMGESVGAVFVELHLLSKFEKLFDRAIGNSGSIYANDILSTVETSKKQAIELVEYLGFKSNDTDEIASFLSKSNPLDVTDAFFELNSESKICVEKSFENVTSIITEYPDQLSIPKHKVVPILGGFNSREDLVTYFDKPYRFLKDDFFEDYLKLLFNVDKEMVDIVQRFYIGDEKISPAVKEGLIDFSSDMRRNYPVQKSLLRYMREGARVYQFMFSYDGTRNYVKNRFNVTGEGAVHADDLSYIFDLSYDKRAPPKDQLMIDRMTKLWTNFVKYGNPTPEITELIPVKWNPVTEDNLYYLNIDIELSLRKRPFHSRMAFWDLFYKAYDKKKLSNIQ